MVNSKGNRLLIAAVFFLTIGFGRIIYCWNQGDSILSPDVLLVVICCSIIGLILIDIHRLRPAKSHTITSLIAQYIFVKLIWLIGYITSNRFKKKCNQCEKQQQNLLREILTQNKDTLFAKDYDLENVDTVETFRKRMPLTTYENYRKYAEMVKEKGTENVLFPGKPFFLGLTSGTTSGKCKVFPKSRKAHRKGLPWILMMIYVMVYSSGSPFLKKWLYVKVLSKVTRTKSGIESGPVSAITYKLNFPFSAIPSNSIQKENEAMYIHLAFSLAEDSISCFSTMVSTTALSLLSVMEKNWESLCDDIEQGQLAVHLDIPVDERNRLNKEMKANPKRAAFLRKEFTKGFKNIVSRIWPDCTCLVALKTGVFATAAKIVKQKFIGDLPIAALLHLSTESTLGGNIHYTNQSQETNYVPLIPINFFEFIPIEEHSENTQSTLLAHQVVVGKMYEIVITTFDGLYRYRTEDVVKITSFYGTTPVYEFMHRAGDILSVHLEKVPECFLHDAVYAAAARWSNQVVEFTSCESIHLQLISATNYDPGYVLFIELEHSNKLDENEIELIDFELCARHAVYATMRNNKKLNPIKVIHMRTGAFTAIKELMLSSNPDAFCMQYKLPRIMRRGDILRGMLDMQI